MDATIRCLPIGGEWQTLGSDYSSGVAPEDISLSSNEWGSDGLSFTLKSLSVRPDLLPYTPILVEIGGTMVWSGRVISQSPQGQDLSVECEGWQYHLDDDLVERLYVHTRMSDWSDRRNLVGAPLGSGLLCASAQINEDIGVMTIMYPHDTTVVANDTGALLLDAGPGNTIKRVVFTYQTSNNNNGTPQAQVGFHGMDDPSGTGITANLWTGALTTVGAGPSTTAITLATAKRCVQFSLFWVGAGVSTNDAWLRLNAVKSFRLEEYESGNASILKGDAVVRDVLPTAPLLNQSTKSVVAGTFSIPEFLASGSPRQLIEMVNAYENYQAKVAGADLQTLEYGPKPSSAEFEVGMGGEFTPSGVSGDQIYDQVKVKGQGADGTFVSVLRTQSGTLVDRRAFHRTIEIAAQRGVGVTEANRLGDLWLTEHRSAPFAGTLQGAGEFIRRRDGGTPIPPHLLLLHTGKKLMFDNLADPDTGFWGREGRIASVKYSPTQNVAELQIDDKRTDFAELLARFLVTSA